MENILEVKPINKKINKVVKIPGSKSISNRALICAALADGTSTLYNFTDCDDTQVLVNSLRKLGLKISLKNYVLKVDGGFNKILASLKEKEKDAPHRCASGVQKFYTKNAGTATRFLTAFLCLLNGDFIVNVNKKMSQRPIKDLVESLKMLGADIKYIKNEGFPPLQIFSDQNDIGGKTCINGNLSSQYLSALLLTMAYSKKGVEINIKNKLVSAPYIKTTLEVVKAFNGKIKVSKELKNYKINGKQKYKPINYKIESDASGATYFMAIAALNGGKVTIKNLGKNSIQADIGFLNILKKMGVQIHAFKDEIKIKGCKTLNPVGKIDLNEIPDAAMTVAILATFAKGKSILNGLYNLRIKECDRLKALTAELKKVGADIKELKSGLIINGDPKKLHGATIETYNDHRMAMCCAVMGSKIAGIKIKNPGCVNKTFPRFWKELGKIMK